ncbi:MAG TPA: hypothetical protein VF292_07955 [Rhodanobacteraceae bacterium]
MDADIDHARALSMPHHAHPRTTDILLAVALTLLCTLPAACTTAKPVLVPARTGRAFAIDCSGANLTWAHCYRKAGEACPLGYKVTQKPYRHGEGVVPGDFLQLIGDGADHRRMLIMCRKAPQPRTLF